MSRIAFLILPISWLIVHAIINVFLFVIYKNPVFLMLGGSQLVGWSVAFFVLSGFIGGVVASRWKMSVGAKKDTVFSLLLEWLLLFVAAWLFYVMLFRFHLSIFPWEVLVVYSPEATVNVVARTVLLLAGLVVGVFLGKDVGKLGCKDCKEKGKSKKKKK